MADSELEEIRKARLAQLQAQAGRGAGPSDRSNLDQRRSNNDRQQEANASQAILSQILLPEAADRLGRIRLVKEERATDIENRLIMLARMGKLQAKVTEEQLKELLNAVAENKKEEKIVINRRKDGWDNDDDYDLSDLRRGF
ncbi:dsDNA-binding protein PDCD5 [Histoplasma ohiense]|nr:dsDNA-binding protein PDCD5 [Histoplasma ohiense (nom. inval.)]